MVREREESEAKEKLVDFLKVYSKKYFIKVKVKVFFHRRILLFIDIFLVITVQQRLKSYITGMRGRKELLLKMWEREQHSMIMQLAKVKNKSKK
jgi:hypothetical protein